MSAFYLGDHHISALVEGAMRLGLVKRGEGTKTGRMLRRANIKSLAARYGDTRESLGVTEPYGYIPPRHPLSDGSLLKQVHCYNYQTCEYDAYERSPAFRLMSRIEAALPHVSRDTAEYNEAPWGI